MRHVVFSLLVGLLLVATASAWAQSGLILPGRLLDNMTATMDPQTDVDCNEDIYASYRLGSRWHNTTDDRLWVCRVNPAGSPRWHLEGTAAGLSLQDAHAIDSADGIGGFTNLTPSRPLTIQPGYATLGPETMRLEWYDQGGFFVEDCTYGSAPGTPCPPRPTFIPRGACFDVLYDSGDPPTYTEAGTICNDINGVLTRTGMFLASGIPFSPAGTVAATNVQAAIEEVAAESGGGAGGPRRMTYPLRLMTIDVDTTNAVMDTTSGTNLDWSAVRYEDNATGCAYFKHRISAALAVTPAWVVKLVHKAVTGAGGNTVLSLSAQTYASNDALDAALSALVTDTTVAVNTATNLTLTTLPTTGDFDSEEPLAPGGFVVVAVCRAGGHASDTLSARWELLDLVIEYLEE